MYTYKAKVIKVIDGDTIDLTVDVGFSITIKERFRLYGINTPEDSLGIPAKEYLALLLRELNNEIIITTVKKEKYGRYLVIISNNPIISSEDVPSTSRILFNGSLNQKMILSGHVVLYMLD